MGRASEPRGVDRVRLSQVAPDDEAEFLAAVRRSRRLHRPWVHPPATSKAFRGYLERTADDRFVALVARVQGGQLAAVVNVSEMVRGGFCSAYLGYYAFEPFAGRGMMTRALAQAISMAFGHYGLHRLEANIQPGNAASRALVQKLGFELEGFSQRYLKVGGRWRDHERWALRKEIWRPKTLLGQILHSGRQP
ncbi:MAG: GNAT family N-acetyltransferase [Myxococcales bacterium]|nr:GNAT family N-acetyltransferase [Myxococcales bacterium]